MEPSNSLGGARIALLIDFDNVILGIDEPGFDIELVVNALRERGTITVSRVYGDWYRHSRHRRRLMEHGVELVEAPAFGPVIKNSADIKIALDGYEIGMTMPHINTFCLVSGDSDFLPLIKKLQGLGKQVLVICGNRFTSDMLRRNCNEFISYENLLAASYGADEDATTLEGAFALLHRAMEALRERGSEIRTSTLKQMMIQLNPVFSEKTFGYNQFRGFLDKAGRENLIKLGPRDRVSGEFYVLLPEEDEADVIENNERAEPAEVVEEIVESRRGGRRRRGDDRNSERKSEKTETPVEVQAEAEPQRPRSRREARLQALREQEELEQQAPAPEAAQTTPTAAPLATPLTPATDFSPADADEAREKSISRDELLARGLRVGKRKFSGKTGSTVAVEPAESQTSDVEADIALTPEDAGVIASPETAGVQTPEVAPEVAAESGSEAAGDEAEAPEAETTEEPQAAEKPKRGRSRRRRKTADAPDEEVTSTDETSTEKAPQVETQATAEDAAKTEGDDSATEQPTEAAESETPAPEEKKPRRRRSTSRKKAEEKAEAAEAAEAEAAQAKAEDGATKAAADEVTAEATPDEAEEKPKPKRARRRKKTDEALETKDETMTEKAIQPDGTQQPVSDQALIEASADTPAAKEEEKPKTRRRRTSRKQAEEKAETEADVTENIVTTDETTGEVSQKELAQIPVPTSEDEV